MNCYRGTVTEGKYVTVPFFGTFILNRNSETAMEDAMEDAGKNNGYMIQ